MSARLFWFAWCAAFAGYNAALTGTSIGDGSAWAWAHGAAALAMLVCCVFWFRWIKEHAAGERATLTAREWAQVVQQRRRPDCWGGES